MLEGNTYSCKDCKTHFALADDIVSKHFYCKNGKAYLFSKVVNVTVGVKEDRMLLTGIHTVADIMCGKCGTIVGWTYVTVPNATQKYKEGKSILERFKLFGPDGSNDSGSDETHIGENDQDNV
ncbi:protein yippee-like [Rutidosis leptorrhynchoides]|uniref:protein yippee-like n=1 Tax=Rutidosis leptorrhynchoides TaxID=125765 RepID=UPI003A9A2749